jgi:VanZ family protein
MYDQLPAILWMLLIFITSSIPSLTLPDLRFVPEDKVVHLIVYLILCAFVHRALLHQRRFRWIGKWSLVCAFFLTVVFGMSDEFHQSFVPNRDASVLDVSADSIGALLFVGYELLRQQRGRRVPV